MARRTSAWMAAAVLAATVAVVAPASAADGPSGALVHVGVGAHGLAALRSLDLQTSTDTELPGSEYGDLERGLLATQGSPDGTKVLARGYLGGIFAETVEIYDTVGHAYTRYYAGPDGDVLAMGWMPDSSHVVAVLSVPPTDMRIYGMVVLGPEGGPIVEIPGTHAYAQTVDGLAVSPSGEQVAFSRVEKGVPKVYLMNIDGTSITPLGVTGTVDAWTHDGSRLLLTVPLFDATGARVGAMAETVTPRGTSPTLLPQTFMPHGGRVGISPDGAWLTVEARRAWAGTGSDVSIVPLDGSAIPVPVAQGVGDADAAASFLGAWTSGDSTPPAMNAVSGVLGASGAVLSWGGIAAPDTVGVRIAVSPGAVPPATYAAGALRRTVFGTARSASFTGLTAGATYSYSAWAVDGAGNASTPITGHFRLIPAAVLSVPAIASSGAIASVPVRYSSGGTGTAGIRIAVYAYSSTGSLSESVVPPGTSGVLAYGLGRLAELGGTVVRFRAGAVDAWGNVRWASTYAYSQVPFDDRSSRLVRSGSWALQGAPSAWAGTVSSTGVGGSVSLMVRKATSTSMGARRFTVIATGTTTGGRVKVYVDGRYVTTVSTRTTSTRYRRVVWTSALLSRASHSVRLIQVTGSGAVRLDGIAVYYTT